MLFILGDGGGPHVDPLFTLYYTFFVIYILCMLYMKGNLRPLIYKHLKSIRRAVVDNFVTKLSYIKEEQLTDM